MKERETERVKERETERVTHRELKDTQWLRDRGRERDRDRQRETGIEREREREMVRERERLPPLINCTYIDTHLVRYIYILYISFYQKFKNDDKLLVVMSFLG